MSTDKLSNEEIGIFRDLLKDKRFQDMLSGEKSYVHHSSPKINYEDLQKMIYYTVRNYLNEATSVKQYHEPTTSPIIPVYNDPNPVECRSSNQYRTEAPAKCGNNSGELASGLLGLGILLAGAGVLCWGGSTLREHPNIFIY